MTPLRRRSSVTLSGRLTLAAVSSSSARRQRLVSHLKCSTFTCSESCTPHQRCRPEPSPSAQWNEGASPWWLPVLPLPPTGWKHQTTKGSGCKKTHKATLGDALLNLSRVWLVGLTLHYYWERFICCNIYVRFWLPYKGVVLMIWATHINILVPKCNIGLNKRKCYTIILWTTELFCFVFFNFILFLCFINILFIYISYTY